VIQKRWVHECSESFQMAVVATSVIRSKNKPSKTGKDLLHVLANTGESVYNPKSSPAYSCKNDDIFT